MWEELQSLICYKNSVGRTSVTEMYWQCEQCGKSLVIEMYITQTTHKSGVGRTCGVELNSVQKMKKAI